MATTIGNWHYSRQRLLTMSISKARRPSRKPSRGASRHTNSHTFSGTLQKRASALAFLQADCGRSWAVHQALTGELQSWGAMSGKWPASQQIDTYQTVSYHSVGLQERPNHWDEHRYRTMLPTAAAAATEVCFQQPFFNTKPKQAPPKEGGNDTTPLLRMTFSIQQASVSSPSTMTPVTRKTKQASVIDDASQGVLDIQMLKGYKVTIVPHRSSPPIGDHAFKADIVTLFFKGFSKRL